MRYSPLLSLVFLGLAACGPTSPTAATSATRAPTPTPTPLPQVEPPRSASLMAYDTAQHVIVLFGGTTLSSPVQPTNETWTWNGSAWQQLHPAASPPAMDGVMAYDAASQQIILVLYNIGSGGRIDNQMWTWNGITWQQAHPSTMPEVVGASMAYDATRRQLILFGGGVPNGHVVTYMNTTWTWDGTTWSQRAPAVAPAPRTGAAMTYDSARQQVILYGGYAQDGIFNDLWTWNGITWQQQHPAQMPPERQQGNLVYDEATQQAILFAGLNWDGAQHLSDTWAWNGTTWTQVDGQNAPATTPESATYDPDQQEIVVYAATGDPKASPPVTPTSQTWIWNGSSWKLLE